jgi:hypothetical protein
MILWFLIGQDALSQSRPSESASVQKGRTQGKRGPQSGIFHTDVPEHPFDVILARPTSRSVTASILAYQDREGGSRGGNARNGMAAWSNEQRKRYFPNPRPDGSEGFKGHRPGWAMPIHQLLVKNKVAVVFHGHDHMFAKEDLDSIVYQLVPQPGNPRSGNPRSAQEYGYTHGNVLGGAGYVHVKVAGNEATVDYVLSLLPGDESGSRKNGEVAFSYTVKNGAAQ